MAEECSICFENIDDITKLNKCEHIFHHNCIKEWTELNQSCPICREDTSPQFVRNIFRSGGNGIELINGIIDEMYTPIDMSRLIIYISSNSNLSGFIERGNRDDSISSRKLQQINATINRINNSLLDNSHLLPCTTKTFSSRSDLVDLVDLVNVDIKHHNYKDTLYNRKPKILRNKHNIVRTNW